MDEFRPLAVCEIARRGSIRAADVRRLEHLAYRRGTVGRQEAEMLFAVHDAARVQHPDWSNFFIEAVVKHVVDEAEPEGYLNGGNVDWLMRWIVSDGRVASRTEIDLLIMVLERARWSPIRLAILALDQVRHAVVHGNGPLRDGMGGVAPGTITPFDVVMIRRILRAFGREAGLAITRAEADALFDIEGSIETAPPTDWTDLLVRATGQALLAGAGIPCTPRAEIFDDASPAVDLIRAESREQRALARLERQRLEIVTGEALADCDAAWLAARMGGFDDLSLREQELLARLEQASPTLVAVLRDQGVEFASPEVAAA